MVPACPNWLSNIRIPDVLVRIRNSPIARGFRLVASALVRQQLIWTAFQPAASLPNRMRSSARLYNEPMNKMIVSNLVHRPIRSLISIFAIAVEVTLILMMVGLMFGMLNDNKERTAAIGADLFVRPPGSSVLMSASGAPASVKVADVLRKLPHAAAVAPVLLQTSTTGSIETIYGIDLPSWNSLGSPFRYLSGGPFQGANDIIFDDY